MLFTVRFHTIVLKISERILSVVASIVEYFAIMGMLLWGAVGLEHGYGHEASLSGKICV